MQRRAWLFGACGLGPCPAWPPLAAWLPRPLAALMAAVAALLADTLAADALVIAANTLPSSLGVVPARACCCDPRGTWAGTTNVAADLATGLAIGDGALSSSTTHSFPSVLLLLVLLLLLLFGSMMTRLLGSTHNSYTTGAPVPFDSASPAVRTARWFVRNSRPLAPRTARARVGVHNKTHTGEQSGVNSSCVSQGSRRKTLKQAERPGNEGLTVLLRSGPAGVHLHV